MLFVQFFPESYRRVVLSYYYYTDLLSESVEVHPLDRFIILPVRDIDEFEPLMSRTQILNPSGRQYSLYCSTSRPCSNKMGGSPHNVFLL